MDNQLRTHTVSSFDKELTGISNAIESMGELVTGSIGTFISNLSNPAGETATKAKEIDQKVNELEKEVQLTATNLIALRNPLAVDLRYLIGAIKISTIIERQGDMVESCVRKILRIKPDHLKSYKEQLTELGTSIIEMMNISISGFKTQDVKEANKIWRMEDRADDLTDEIFAKIKEDIKKNPAEVDDFISLMLIVRSLERFADYCTNISKTVNYIVSGERVTEADF